MNHVAVLMDPVLLQAGDGTVFSEYVDVSAGQIVAFEVLEFDASATIPLPRVLFDPSVSFDGRRVVCRFGQDFPPATSDDRTFYAPVVPSAKAFAWQPLSLEAGQDYEQWFSAFDSFAHGPQPQLTARLELLGVDAPGALVAFDDIDVRLDFATQSEQGLTDEIRAELDRLIQNHIDYGVDVDPTSQELNIHVRNSFEIGDGTQEPLNLGTHSPLSDFVRNCSTQFLHPVATPWMLDEVDSVVRIREPAFGLPRAYRYSAGQYVPPQDGQTFRLHDDIEFLLGAYDITHDVHTLDMAYELGLAILDEGGSAANPLYQSTFLYQAAGPALLPEHTPQAFEGAFKEWGKALRALVLLSTRTGAWPGRYSRHAEFLPAATGIADWIEQIVTLVGGYYPYWMSIDNQLGDKFGYQSSPCTVAHDEVPHASFLAVIEQGVEEFHPEWVQTFPRATGMAGDQQRAWDGWLTYMDQDLATRTEFGRAYLDATLNYVRACRLGNGVWAGTNASDFHQPGLGGLGGTPVVPADGNKFKPLAQAWAHPTLASQGIVTQSVREDLMAYMTTMFRVNTPHYGHNLEYLGLSTGQLGYLTSAAFPDPLDADPTTNAGFEFRSLGAAHRMMEQLEPALGNKRPSAAINPNGPIAQGPGAPAG